MNRFKLLFLFISITLLISCSSVKLLPEADESILVFYVEEFHKPINKPVVELQVDNMENTIRMALKAPASIVRLEPAELLHANGWLSKKGTTINGLSSFDFTAPANSVTLAPIKIQIVSRSQIEVKALTPIDLKYAKERFAQNPELAGITINYPVLETE